MLSSFRVIFHTGSPSTAGRVAVSNRSAALCPHRERRKKRPPGKDLAVRGNKSEFHLIAGKVVSDFDLALSVRAGGHVGNTAPLGQERKSQVTRMRVRVHYSCSLVVPPRMKSRDVEVIRIM